jgi:hypothetical protein
VAGILRFKTVCNLKVCLFVYLRLTYSSIPTNPGVGTSLLSQQTRIVTLRRKDRKTAPQKVGAHGIGRTSYKELP